MRISLIRQAHALQRISKEQIAELLSKPLWSASSMLIEGRALAHTPSNDDVRKIARLSGLKLPAEEFCIVLQKQLRLVEGLSDVDTTGVEPLHRLVKEVDCRLPMGLDDLSDPEAWDPTSLSEVHDGSYYVVKDGLRHDPE